MTHRISRLLLTGLLVFAVAGSARAHAYLDHAAPPNGSTLSVAPTTVRLWFTQAIEPAFSGIEITDAAGARVDDGNPRFDRTLMQVGLKKLPPGEYKVHWHVISVDTHATEGEFSFKIIGQ